MDYTIISTATTPNNRQLDILLDKQGDPAFALHINKESLYDGNKKLLGYRQPQAEICFSDELDSLLLIDASRGEELNNYDRLYGITLYTENEYLRKLNGYTPIALNK